MKCSIQLPLIATAAVFVLTTATQAVVLARYEFTGGSGTVTSFATDVVPGNFTPTGNVPTTVGLSGGGNSFVRANNTKSSEALALTDLGTPAGDYHQVTISAGPGKTLDLTSLTFLLGHTTDNSTSFTSTAVLTSSVNGFGMRSPELAASRALLRLLQALHSTQLPPLTI